MATKNKFREPAKNTQKSLDEDDNSNKYNGIKNELDVIYNHITEGIFTRSRCNWYEQSIFEFRKTMRSSNTRKKTYC